MNSSKVILDGSNAESKVNSQENMEVIVSNEINVNKSSNYFELGINNIQNKIE